jgi:hypothetical protein
MSILFVRKGGDYGFNLFGKQARRRFAETGGTHCLPDEGVVVIFD